MSQVPLLDSATEQRLHRALSKVADRIADGDSATEAIIKVAADANLSRGQAELMVRSYNTGRTLYQFDTAHDLEEKLAEFPLADADEVVSALFPASVKTAAEVQHDETVSADYNFSPRGWLRRAEQAEQAEKHAQVLVDARLARRPTKTAEIDRPSTAHANLMATARAANDADQSVQAAKYACAEAIGDLADYFRRADALPFNSVRENATLVYGEKAAAVLDDIASDAPYLKKVASRMHPVDWSQSPYNLITTIFEKVANFSTATTKAAEKQAAAKEAREVLYGPFAQSPVLTGGSVWDSLCSMDDLPPPTPGQPIDIDDLLKTAAGGPASPAMWAGIGTGLVQAVKGLGESAFPAKENVIKGHMAKLQDPAHEQQLRQIRTQSLLSDLMLNDPVISGYGQDDVLDAYTRLSEVAPAAVQHKLLAQALLSKYLEQGNRLEPFDMDQLIGIENKINRQPAPPQAPPVAK